MEGFDDIPLLDLDEIPNFELEGHVEMEKGSSSQKLKFAKGSTSKQLNPRKDSENGVLD